MRRIALMLCIAWVYVGCARPGLTPLPETKPLPEPRPGGRVRVALPADIQLSSESLSYLSAVDVVSTTGSDAAQLMLLGEADLAIVVGGDAAKLAAAQRPIEMRRAPGWDRLYFLWSDPSFRWTADPNFRRWLGGVIDRDQLSSLLFDGYASASWRLLSAGGAPAWPDPVRSPFASSSRPVLRLVFDDDDPAARAIASRMKATLATERVELQLETDLRGSRDLHLLRFDRQSEDSREALTRILSRLPNAEEPIAAATQYLEQGALFLAEESLLLEANAIPIIRLQAWVATDRRLVEVAPGFIGDLGLREAWWQR